MSLVPFGILNGLNNCPKQPRVVSNYEVEKGGKNIPEMGKSYDQGGVFSSRF